MKYASDFKKFVSSQYVNSGLRIAFAILIPGVILARYGLLREYFLFPLGTSFVGGTDQPGPFIRRRNTLIFASFCFVFVAAVASLLKDYPMLAYGKIVFFGIFFSMLGVYGQRLGAVGSIALVVMAIFIDGHLTGEDFAKNMLILLAGCLWFVLFLYIVAKIQPYKLASQMIGENYLELAEYLRLKSFFYGENPDFDKLFSRTISEQIKIKDLQEATRETVFKTREIVNEATTTSRLLMLMFLNSIDLHEKLLTSESEYLDLHKNFRGTQILPKIGDYLLVMANELANIGIALQSGIKTRAQEDLNAHLSDLYNEYFELRNRRLSPDTLENFMVLRHILTRIANITEEINSMYGVLLQDARFAKSLSTGLDFQRFLPDEQHLNINVFKNNLSLKSGQFRHALRLTAALLVGYIISKFFMLGVGHTYWILITIIAIMKPAYSITKNRNFLRLAGTVCGGIFSYLFVYMVPGSEIQFFALLLSITLCYSLIRTRYFWSVFFMTSYILISFNFLKPGNAAFVFRDRLMDTAVGSAVAFVVSYFVLPFWEHNNVPDLMRKSLSSNKEYFETVIGSLRKAAITDEGYRIARKNSLINLANLSDSFQKMISDPKSQRKRAQTIHQFVNTSHLVAAYTASLAQFSGADRAYPEIDFEKWQRKISAELMRTSLLLDKNHRDETLHAESRLTPDDEVEELLEVRKAEIAEEEFYDRRDITKTTRLTELKNIREILRLIYNSAKEQRKMLQNFYLSTEQQ